MEEADRVELSSRWGGLIDLQVQQLLQVFVLGAAVGIMVWLLGEIGRDVVFGPLVCGEGAAKSCEVNTLASSFAVGFSGVIGLIGLVRLGFYRPIITVVATAACLWGLAGWVSGMAWHESLIWSGLIYGIFYALFAWLSRPRALAPVLLLVAAVVLLTRLTSML